MYAFPSMGWLVVSPLKYDFCAKFYPNKKIWFASWKGPECQTPVNLRMLKYPIPEGTKEEYDREQQMWIDNGWLHPYHEKKIGPTRGLRADGKVQKDKSKVQPVLDYRELNECLDAHTASADKCAQKLREWRQIGSDAAILDLRCISTSHFGPFKP